MTTDPQTYRRRVVVGLSIAYGALVVVSLYPLEGYQVLAMIALSSTVGVMALRWASQEYVEGPLGPRREG